MEQATRMAFTFAVHRGRPGTRMVGGSGFSTRTSGSSTSGILSPPTLVGITAFTCTALICSTEVASISRGMRIPVIMGGIHASMCKEEAKGFVDSVVVGEAETVLAKVLEDALAKRLRGFVYRIACETRGKRIVAT